ncbi:variable surface protein [Plasmodium gonderi]|uniref:Variable surface protein n=1 Tax=Plasmodium gonderi TaxID=77519 RepID=A0A1Y1JNT7_PLAGO|nr:variable surface protein [Plasmodium gonderi]GAW84129.1 variable surface protein [Plasmodium gonderi]
MLMNNKNCKNTCCTNKIFMVIKMIYIIMCLTDDCLGTCKNNFFKTWDETKLSTEINESHDMLIKLQREDDELFHLGCSLYENYSNLGLYKHKYKNVCDLFKEWLNNRINEYREKNKLCSKNELLDSTFKVLWEYKKNSQVDEEENLCEWEPPTGYYCYQICIYLKKYFHLRNSKLSKLFIYLILSLYSSFICSFLKSRNLYMIKIIGRI